LSESPSHGLPVALYDPGSKGAQAYLELARELTETPGHAWLGEEGRS
jgi:chromosome partitioning protein